MTSDVGVLGELTGASHRVAPGGSPLALDNSTKSASAPGFDPETGEVLAFDPTLKWQLQHVARSALGASHRLRICYRYPVPDTKSVKVHQSEKSQRAYFAKLMTCGSVWCCPVCASKIQSYRAEEARAAIDAWTDRGGVVALVTQTIRHGRWDQLDELVAGFALALRKFKGQRAYGRASETFGISGSIRALEVTWGDRNGWHPHAHTLLFLEAGTDVDALKSMLWPLWKSAVARSGLGTVSLDAFDVGDGSAVRTYVTKMGREYQWNSEHELVKSHTKRGNGSSGMTPFDFLRSHLDDPADGRWLARFAEFTNVFHGRRQLVWSNGLKVSLLGDLDLTDEQVAASIGENDPVLASISLSDWVLIRRRNLQATVLVVAEQHGLNGINHLLESMKEKTE